MRLLSTFVAALLVAGTFSVAGAADNPAAKPRVRDARQAQKALPLQAKLVKVDGQQLTVMTQPVMTPDGLVEAREKTYDLAPSTPIVINREPKTLADLQPGAPLRLMITPDGKTVAQVQSNTPAAATATPEGRAAKKAQRDKLP